MCMMAHSGIEPGGSDAGGTAAGRAVSGADDADRGDVLQMRRDSSELHDLFEKTVPELPPIEAPRAQ
jgi:hypothetical protein